MLHDMKLSQSRLEHARWHSEASGVLLRLCNAAWLQADGFEIAPSLLLCLPHPRPSGLCTHNKPALLLHPSVFLNVCLLKSSSQPSLCSIILATAPSACLEFPDLLIFVIWRQFALGSDGSQFWGLTCSACPLV